MFAITSHKGFHMRFANGVTVSVQFGPGNYCQHNNIFDPVAREGKDIVDIFEAPKRQNQWESRDAEVAAWDKYGLWITQEVCPEEHDSVIGYLSAEKVLEFLVKAAAYIPKDQQFAQAADVTTEGGETGG